MSADGGFVELEASGETIGEAKWQALRELERLHPGLDRNAVTFEVLTEGERGLLGVGTSPARVLARVESAAIREAPAPDADASPIAGLAVRARGTHRGELLACRRGSRWRRTTNPFASRCPRPTSGVLIGRDGRTIDAMQHVVSSIAYRATGRGRQGGRGGRGRVPRAPPGEARDDGRVRRPIGRTRAGRRSAGSDERTRAANRSPGAGDVTGVETPVRATTRNAAWWSYRLFSRDGELEGEPGSPWTPSLRVDSASRAGPPGRPSRPSAAAAERIDGRPRAAGSTTLLDD